MVSFLTSFHDRSEGPEVLNTSVSTSSQEHIIHFLAQQTFTRLETHVMQGFFKRTLFHVTHTFCSGDMSRNGHTHSRIGTISNHRLDICRIKTNLLVEHGIVIALQRLPISQCLVPFRSFRRIFTTFNVFKGHFVRRNHSSAGTHLDRQVAQGETSFHGQAADSFTGIFHKVTCGTTGRHLRHHIQGYILGCHTFSQLAVNRDTHGFRTSLKDALRSHHHFHLTGTDSESNRSHCTVSRSM
ncbi:flp pilus assembly protein TadG [Bacteroides sp. CAG:875]|nr:flp pilus assembly protein TadG [Bacteroides sp. CAG:875]